METESTRLREYDARLRMLASGFAACGLSFDDLLQEARIAFLQAVRQWREDGGASLWTFARLRVLGRLAEVAKTETRHALDSSGEAFDQPTNGPTPEEECATKIAIEKLTPIEREALKMSLIDGAHDEQIGQKLGVHRTTAMRIAGRAAARVRS